MDWNEVNYMDIKIDKDAVEYIQRHSKDNSVMLYIHTARTGYNIVPTPTVELGMPEHQPEHFDLHVCEGINVYVHKDVKAQHNEIHIEMKRHLGIKGLEAEGMSINY
jgi:hypothetical protein